jgi:hypothetical protein
MNDVQRELTREERSAIKKLVISSCANYCREYGCLQLNDACYMQRKVWTGAYCKYFRTAVLPLNPKLKVALIDGGEKQSCEYCGVDFHTNGKRIYCGANCAKKAQKKRNRDFMRKKRGQ